MVTLVWVVGVKGAFSLLKFRLCHDLLLCAATCLFRGRGGACIYTFDEYNSCFKISSKLHESWLKSQPCCDEVGHSVFRNSRWSTGPNQARSQAYVSGVARLSRRSHVVRSLRAYFIPYAIKIKWIMCVLKKLNFLICCRGQGSEIRVELNQNFRSLLC